MGDATSTRAHPFVKWAGGKTQLLRELREAVPATWDPERDAYFEPFLGGGALYFELSSRRAVLNDACFDLVNAWTAVREDVDLLVRLLRDLESSYRKNPECTYYEVRSRHNLPTTTRQEATERAARFVFLNRTCFNGLYRLNSRGEHNVSWCKDGDVMIVDEANLRACSDYLGDRSVRLCCRSFEDHLRSVILGHLELPVEGSLVYLDPPYVPRSRTSYFQRYTKDGFGRAKQLEVVVLAARLRDLGAHVVVSQSADERMAEEFEAVKFQVRRVKSKRRISCDGEGRGEVEECIMVGISPSSRSEERRLVG